MRKIPFLSSMDTPWHDESILVGLYQWYGDEIPNADIVNQLEYAVIGENDVIFRGKCTETCMELCIYSNRELKQYPIQCIGYRMLPTKKEYHLFSTQIIGNMDSIH